MKKNYVFLRTTRAALSVLLMGLLMLAAQAGYGQATVDTDKYDYLPGETVKITGKGWEPGETVSMVLKHLTYDHSDELLSAVAGADGKIFNNEYVIDPKDLGESFLLTATGLSSGEIATTTFTDGGGDYTIKFRAYDPATYKRVIPPVTPKPIGRAISPLGNTTIGDGLDPSLTPKFLGLGQIVAYEFLITVKSYTPAACPCPSDQITFTARFATQTTSNDPFGFDPTYNVYAAFVDSYEGGITDISTQASVLSIVNTSGPGYFEGTITVTGLDCGDVIPVEVWVVLNQTIPAKAGGNVQTSLQSAATSGTCQTGQTISTGNQTNPLNQVGQFFTTDVDISVTKTDSQDPVAIGSPFWYILTVKNTGPSVANTIKISDILNSNFNVDVNAITFSADNSTFVDDALWGHTFIPSTNTLELTKLSLGINETVYIKIPVTWKTPYIGNKTSGKAGDGAAGLTCAGDLVNKVSISTISDDIVPGNNSYCQPTNVYCSLITLTATPIQPKCFGETGSVSLSASGGKDPYTYSTANPHTGLSAGTYNYTVTDAYGCTASASAVINAAPSQIMATAVPTQIKCFGEKGSITLTVSGGTQFASPDEPYTYEWTASEGVSIPEGMANDKNLTDLVAGTYFVTVTDKNGCKATASATINTAPTELKVNLTITNQLSYISAADGAISSSVEGGTATYSYKWTTSSGGVIPTGQDESPNLTGINVPGNYILTVTDKNGCTAWDEVYMDPLATASITITHTDIACCNFATGGLLYGTISLTVIGGPGTPSYAWASTDGAVPDGQVNNEDLTGIYAAGTYTVTITFTRGDGTTVKETRSATVGYIKNEEIPPVLTVPAAYNGLKDATCTFSALPAVTGQATATDNCDAAVSVTYTDEVSASECSTVITRTWKAEDNCGNFVTGTQTITFIDDTDPTFVSCPASITVCETEPVPLITKPTATDNCDGNVIVTWVRSDKATGLNDPFPAGTTTITFTATDECDNAASCEMTVTIAPCSWINLRKTTLGVVNPDLSWSFTLYEGSYPNFTNPISENTLGVSDGILFESAGPLSIYKTYTVCELGVPAGYGTRWAIDPDGEGPIGLTPIGYTLYPGTSGVFNPQSKEAVPQDLGNRCYEIAGSALLPNTIGDNTPNILLFEVDNTFPGGDPRTPGYWKNWNTCTGGGQVNTATNNSTNRDAVPGIQAYDRWASGWALLDDIIELNGINWGSFVIAKDDAAKCDKAQKILDNRDLNGVNRSSDPAYMLAKHLLAYQLNLGAGTYICPDMVTIETEAVQLLNGIGFNGIGASVLNKATSPANKEKASRALYLGGILDKYNNGIPCDQLGIGGTPPPVTPPATLNCVVLVSNVNSFNGSDGEVKITVTGGTPDYSFCLGTTCVTQSGLIYTFTGKKAGTYSYSVTDSKGNLCSGSVTITQPKRTKSGEIATGITPDVELADLKVYPNPFSEKLRFEFVSPESVNARIDLYDMTGRMVKTIFEQPIEGGTMYNAEFKPEAIISGMYFYRMTMGEAIFNGKVVFKKE
jgi:uncharacterized repeat protein (TIGR01451 family)